MIQLMDNEGLQVGSDHYYRIGTSLELFCQVTRYWTKPNVFTWFRMGRPLALDLWRGGISIHTESDEPGQLGSRLIISNVSSQDSGNYSCVLDDTLVSTFLHVLKEENQAVIQQTVSSATWSRWHLYWLTLLSLLDVFC